MKVILPVAGKGTRLLPLTKEIPKPLVRVAGRPVLDYVVEKVASLDVEELIFITGHLKEAIEHYVKMSYDVPARFVEQRVQDGTAGAVHLARPYVDGPVMIIFVDTVFDADLSLVDQVDADGIVWAKEVEDYQRFGVVVTDGHGYMQRIVEKPQQPISRLANIGLYYIRDWQTLFRGIDETLAGPQMKGEWFLTDAFQYMIDNDKKLYTAEVEGWYDCGKVETLLETNAHLLSSGRERSPTLTAGVTVIDPVYVADGVRLEDCTIGPTVSIDGGVTVRSSTLRHAIVGRSSYVEGSQIEHSLLGDGVVVKDKTYDWMIATRDELDRAP
jgi:glucose-1-phosphate thymidylyltransferase